MRSRWLALMALAVGLLCLLYARPEQSMAKAAPLKSSPEAAKLRACILRPIPAKASPRQGRKYYKGLTETINACLARHARIDPAALDSFNMGRLNERKIFVRPVDPQHSGHPCNFLTVGVGGDWQVEAEFRAKYPHCRVFGIEPSPDQVKGFANYGTVIPHAVGVEPGRAKLKLRKGSVYRSHELAVIPLHKLLDDYVGSRRLLYSTMDIEGFEYNILEGLRRGAPLAKANVRICQVDVEFHTLVWKPAEFSFGRYFRRLLTETGYIPIAAEDFLSHRKMSLVLAGDPDCERIFNFRRLLKA